PIIPYLLGLFSQPQALGDIPVKIQINDRFNSTVFSKTYFITQGTYSLKTNFAVDTGYTVFVSIPKLNYERSIIIG
ncbi:MAG: hypothetical protein NC827_09430, partial [Candidatus Omnitrophica bacterium]|nr:hypothetical protein [Candidatus Omnitrophota bacterium]